MLDIIDTIESSREEQANIDQIYAKFNDTVIGEMNNSIPNFVIGGESEKRLKILRLSGIVYYKNYGMKCTTG